MRLRTKVLRRVTRLIVAATASLAALTVSPPGAAAAVVLYSFQTGTPTSGPAPLLMLLDGQSVSGTFAYNDAAGPPAIVQAGPFAGSLSYPEALSLLSGTVDGESFSGFSGRILVSNDNFRPIPVVPASDAVLLVSSGATFSGFTLGDFNLVGAQVSWFENTTVGSDFLDDQSQPADLISLGSPNFALQFQPVGGGPVVPVFFPAQLFQAQLSAVPEPEIWAMLLIGFAALGLVMRRRRGDAMLRSDSPRGACGLLGA